jgi:hypothetical protein
MKKRKNRNRNRNIKFGRSEEQCRAELESYGRKMNI